MPAAASRFSRRAGWLALGAGLLIAGTALFFGGKVALERYLNGSGLQQSLSEKAGALADSPSGFLPFRWNGLHADSGGFLAQGRPGNALRLLRARDFSAQCEIVDLWRRQLRVKTLAIEELQAALSGDPAQLPPLPLPAVPPLVEPKDEASTVKLDLQEIDVKRLTLLYGDQATSGGRFQQVHTRFWPKDPVLFVHGEGGTFHQAGFPEALLRTLDLEYRKPVLKVLSGTLSVGRSGRVDASGQFEFTRPGSMKLGLLLRDCDAGLFIPPAMKEKFTATFESATTIEEELGEKSQATASGTVACHGAVLSHLEGLDKVAAFTHEPRLRELHLQLLSAAYRSRGDELGIRHLVAEAKGLLRVEGDVNIHGEALEADLELGVAPKLVESFPGAQDDVFTKARDGYLWTTVELRGTTKSPKQNLKPRLVKAAEKYFARKLLAPVLKPGEKVVQEIKELF